MNPLQQLQEDSAAMLLGNPVTKMVPYTSFRKQVIESLQDEAQAAWKIRVDGQIGVACLVMMPEVRMKYPNVPGPQFEIRLTIRTFEDPRVNNTGFSCEDVAAQNLAWLDGMLIEDLTELYGDTDGPALKPNYDYPGFLVYDSILMGQLPQDAMARTAPPNMQDDNAGNVTLTCNDLAAGLFYTTDGTMPVPGAPAGDVGQNLSYAGEKGSTQIYQGPFAVASGQVVRVVAWNPARLPSHVAKGTITF